jgi:hypothetical protein
VTDVREAEFRILEAAVESWIGLWELVWILRPLSPGQSDADIVPSAQTLVRTLVDRGQLYLAQLEDRPPDKAGELGETVETVLAEQQTNDAISTREAWDPPRSERDPHIVVAVTNVGQKEYQTRLQTRHG